MPCEHLQQGLHHPPRPRNIIWWTGIPKNKSGKILRRVLKARYEGKDPGDLSTMEEK